MLTRRIRTQLTVFVVIAALAVTIMSVSYVRLPQLLGFGQFTVTADFADGTGLYPNALVTYRGVDVGKVDSMDLTPTGVLVRMRINNGTRVPTDTTAEILSTSAIGEQYVELVPQSDAGPYLRGGMTIAQSHTVGMPQSGPLLDGLNSLLVSIPKPQLTQLLGEVTTAFGGTGPRLSELLTDSATLVRAAAANLAPTTSLISNLAPMLATQQQISGQITASVNNLASFTDQLTASNAQIKQLILDTSPLAGQVDALINNLTPTLPILLANLTSVGQVVEEYLPGLRQLLVIFPPLIAFLGPVVLPDEATQSANLDFKLNLNNPPPCTTGFIPSTQRRSPTDLSVANTPSGIYCNVAPSDPRDVRGVRNTPCALEPGYRGASPTICAEEAAGKPISTALSSPQNATSIAGANYSPTTGQFVGPDGQLYMLGQGTTTPVSGPQTWQDLMKSLVGE